MCVSVLWTNMKNRKNHITVEGENVECSDDIAGRCYSKMSFCPLLASMQNTTLTRVSNRGFYITLRLQKSLAIDRATGGLLGTRRCRERTAGMYPTLLSAPSSNRNDLLGCGVGSKFSEL